MKRIGGIIAILVVFISGFLLLGNSRSAEGPGHGGGVTASASAKSPAAPQGPAAIPVTAAACRANRRSKS